MKYFLQRGDRVFTTGAFLVYDQKHNKFLFDGFEDDDTFFDGESLQWTKEKDGKPYIEE